MNLVPAVVIAACGSIAGIMKSLSIKKRVKFLSQCAEMLEEFEVRIRYGSEEIAEIITELAASGRYGRLGFLAEITERDFRPQWEKAVQRLPLNKDDARLLLDLGARLGASDLAGQLSMLESAKIRLERSLEDAAKEYAEKGRMFRSAGVLCGIACAVAVL